ncbi:hypothetical protein GUJ93_ZPchr0005g15217 [Zizania palustris]|uniref:Phytocyanin domain-containing protein n=1 Tax=Zizania palustris TaxID=103762 RepID=A0A8J5SMU2_ZIZPA|nr:hypothetical protein GUJ93_ZPchr0005g15217 [Zizania palustris]
MMASKTHYTILLLSAVTTALFAGSAAGVYHIIGTGKRNISIGDKLMFLYRRGVYNIVEVPTKELFDKCCMKSIINRYQNGPTIIELTQQGLRYYFCGIGNHCEEGQKLAINVSAVAPPQLDAPNTSSATASTGAALRYLAGLAVCVVSELLM